jgi:hypothetical protein
MAETVWITAISNRWGLDGRLQLNYPVVMGDERLGDAYGGILGLPVTYLIDGGGRIRAKYEGDANLESVESEINRLLQSH